MRNKYIFPLIAIVIGSIIHMYIVPLLTIGFFRPEIYLMIVGFYTLKFGRSYGMILGALTGLLSDILGYQVIGSNMFAFIIFAFIIGYFFNENSVEKNTKTILFSVFVFVSTVISLYIKSLVLPSDTDTSFVSKFFDYSLSPAIYTSLLCLIMILFRSEREIS